jgi:D-aminopeptidase
MSDFGREQHGKRGVPVGHRSPFHPASCVVRRTILTTRFTLLNFFVPLLVLLLVPLMVEAQVPAEPEQRPRAREVGIVPGILPPGPRNAITDVAGVRVGQVTLREGESIRTGVTAILPHGGNLFRDKVPAAIHVGNGFGKLMGITQVRELGEIETPILLTCTLCVPRVADAVLDYMLAENPEARSVNPVVGETNDGTLNDIRARAVRAEHVLEAIRGASDAEVAEGAVGAGTGTVAFGWKGGIGTASRRLPPQLGGHTVGVLVQSNYGGVLQIVGAPVGRELGQFFLHDVLDRGDADGSIMIVVATDAPLDPRNLERLAARAILGLARTGSPMTNGSGDYVIAFSTAESVRRTPERRSALHDVTTLPNDLMSPLFQAAVEATEEAIYNSLLRAATETGHAGRTVEALPLEPTLDILRRYNALRREEVRSEK